MYVSRELWHHCGLTFYPETWWPHERAQGTTIWPWESTLLSQGVTVEPGDTQITVLLNFSMCPVSLTLLLILPQS